MCLSTTNVQSVRGQELSHTCCAFAGMLEVTCLKTGLKAQVMFKQKPLVSWGHQMGEVRTFRLAAP